MHSVTLMSRGNGHPNPCNYSRCCVRGAIWVWCNPLGLNPNFRRPWKQVDPLFLSFEFLWDSKNASLSQTDTGSAPFPCGLSFSPWGTDGRSEIRPSECGTGEKCSCWKEAALKADPLSDSIIGRPDHQNVIHVHRDNPRIAHESHFEMEKNKQCSHLIK